MKVQLERTFPIPVNPDVTWQALHDIEALAACMPGAKITEPIDERLYRGTVTVKVGPATLAFCGEIEVKTQDAATRTLRIIAKGTDTFGSSSASLDLTARVEAAGDGGSTLLGSSEASVAGRAAFFGGRMMDAVADEMLQQFAVNFRARVEAQQRPPVARAAAAADAAYVIAMSDPATLSTAASLSGLTLLWSACRTWLREMGSGPE